MSRRRTQPRFLVGIVGAIIALCCGPSDSRAEDVFILHPGYVTGTISIPGHTIYRVVISASAYDPVAQKSYTAQKTIQNEDTYVLVVEAGEWEYTVSYTIYFDGNTTNTLYLTRKAAPAPGETVVVDLASNAVVEGTISVTGETVQDATVQVYPAAVPPGQSAYFNSATALARQPAGSTDPVLSYSVPIFGGGAPKLQVRASSVRLTDPNDFVGFPYGDEIDGVPPGGTATRDFHLDPGYVEGTITVNGASITTGNVGATVIDLATNRTILSAATKFFSGGTYRFPVPPSGPGQVVRLYGSVQTNLGTYGFTERDIELAAGETATSDWTIDLDGTISGDVVITGVTVDSIRIYGYGPHGAYRNLTLYTEGEYLLDGLIPGEWRIRTEVYDRELDYQLGYYNFDYYYYPQQSVDLAPGTDESLDFSFTAGFLGGQLLTETLGLRDYLLHAYAYAYAESYPNGTTERAYSMEYDPNLNDEARGDINHFEMFVAPGVWQLRDFELRFYLPVKSPTGEDLPYPQNWSYSRLTIAERDYDNGTYPLPLLSVGPGETVESDLNYDLGLIVPRLSSPDEVFRQPRVDSNFKGDKDGGHHYGSSTYAYTNQADVNEARVTLAVMPGWHELTARAYVQDTLVIFGPPFMVYVDPGDVVYPDIEGPEVFILFPPGNYVTHETCVAVQGSVTSDVAITSLTINGTEVMVAEDGTFTLQVCDLALGDNPLEVSASNASGHTTTVIRTITRINDAPEVVAGGPYVGYEGTPVSFDAGGSTDYEGDSLTFRWDFDNNGTWDASGSPASHTWYDDHAGTVLVEVADEFNTATGTAEVTILNVAPAIADVNAPTDPVAREATFDISVDFTDPGTGDTHTAAFDWGDGNVTQGTVTGNGEAHSATAAYSYGVSGPHEVTITVTDDDGGSASTTVTVVVNTPPQAALGASYEGTEGSSVTFDASESSDADGDTLWFRWDFDGDGVWDTDYSTVPTATHLWEDDHAGTVIVEVSDGDLTDTATGSVAILNAPPQIVSLSATADPTPVGTAVDLAGSFTDAGTLDTHSATIDWGDGASTAGVVTETAGSGTVSASHAYATPGIYTVTCTVEDDDGGATSATFQYVVVYDGTGAFVTGGGQVDSPAGAYAPDPALTGKAVFGFVSKYQKGASAPEGNTSFHFHVAGMMFKSTSYEWLVVAGAKAKFKGEGQIGGAGNYGFMLTAIDGDLAGGGGPDRFRIKIWDKNNGDQVVYDNQMDAADDADPTTVVTQGAIKIHQG